MIIRRERPADAAGIREVIAAAFARPDGTKPPEAWLVDALREDTGWLPTLSLVATDHEEITGHVVATRAKIGEHPALGLGPLSVRPGHQRNGVGKALMHAVLAAAEALDEPLVALLGDPAYYGRFGFRPAAEYGITPPEPEWAQHFQVRTLTAYDPGTRGAFAYAEPFSRL